jgi:hypothetical protein
VAGGHPAGRHYNGRLRRGISQRLGQQIWCSSCGDLGQGSTIHFCCVEWTLSEAGDQPQAYHCLPPAGQWFSGAFPQAAEGGTAGEAGHWGLV